MQRIESTQDKSQPSPLLRLVQNIMAWRSRQARPPLSKFSSPAVPNSGWSSQNFMLGAGMVIIQPSTHKIVVVYDTKQKYWFFPRGRKDAGESLEVTAIREAYEESGYQVEFLPLYTPSHAPPPPNERDFYTRPNTEPFYMTITSWAPGGKRKHGGEYLTSWYIGQIPKDAVHTPGTGMADEENFKSYLLTYEEVMDRVTGNERHVLYYAWTVYLDTLRIEEDKRRRGSRSIRTSSDDNIAKDTRRDSRAPSA